MATATPLLAPTLPPNNYEEIEMGQTTSLQPKDLRNTNSSTTHATTLILGCERNTAVRKGYLVVGLVFKATALLLFLAFSYFGEQAGHDLELTCWLPESKEFFFGWFLP
jgi:hypothetical protein